VGGADKAGSPNEDVDPFTGSSRATQPIRGRPARSKGGPSAAAAITSAIRTPLRARVTLSAGTPSAVNERAIESDTATKRSVRPRVERSSKRRSQTPRARSVERCRTGLDLRRGHHPDRQADDGEPTDQVGEHSTGVDDPTPFLLT